MFVPIAIGIGFKKYESRNFGWELKKQGSCDSRLGAVGWGLTNNTMKNYSLKLSRYNIFRLILPAIMLHGSICVSAQSTKQNLNIVFIGNSITYGAGLADPATEAPPVIACNYLRVQPGIGKVAFANCGYSGFTTVDFLPSTAGAFVKVEAAAHAFKDKKALLLFSIKLGTNDSAIEGPNGSPVSPEAYKQNLKTIADSLLKEVSGLYHHISASYMVQPEHL